MLNLFLNCFFISFCVSLFFSLSTILSQKLPWLFVKLCFCFMVAIAYITKDANADFFFKVIFSLSGLFPLNWLFPLPVGFGHYITPKYLVILILCLVLGCVCVQLCGLCDPVDHSPPGSSVRGILQGRILECAVISSCGGSCWPRSSASQVDFHPCASIPQGSTVACVTTLSFQPKTCLQQKPQAFAGYKGQFCFLVFFLMLYAFFFSPHWFKKYLVITM